ncbi:hypothetical protein L195_g031538 [Trifolium pratense]|uniref:Uncharacterized protein n=1 Tax=Trifolium pratense TaxID=57577 RepID=A0A2K3LAP9_TRIPR|nr:hypothetical protein L195_g031538 [Trifolium pratense]
MRVKDMACGTVTNITAERKWPYLWIRALARRVPIIVDIGEQNDNSYPNYALTTPRTWNMINQSEQRSVNTHPLTLEKERTRRSEEITSPVQVINPVFIAGTYGFQQAWTSQSFMRS